MDQEQTSFVPHPELSKLQAMRESGLEYRRRRHDDWTTNYTLYRDKVTYNRLTQRQSVHLPLIKSAIQSILKDIDDAPLLYFDCLDNNDQKELFFNEYWKFVAKENKLEIQDLIDKKQVLLYGRSFKFLNIIDGLVRFEIVDPQDVLIDRYVNPASIDSARFLIRQNIYKPLDDLQRMKDLNAKELSKLTEFFNSEDGELVAEENMQDYTERQDRLEALGVENVLQPTLGETYVSLEEFYVKEWSEEKEAVVIYYYIVAEDKAVLLKAELCDVLGYTGDDFWQSHYPAVTWASDPERTDFWSDGVADTLRGPNEVVDVWYSQTAENRTLKNFNMNYYDATKTDDFVPQMWNPQPWGWYGVPGNPNDVMKNVEVADLSDGLDELQFVINMAQQAVAASATNQGALEQQKRTLGEIQLAISNAKDRVKSNSKFYTDSWLEFGLKYTKLLESNKDIIDPVSITKKGKLGLRFWTRTIAPKDWEAEKGYQTDVKMIQDKQAEDLDALNKLAAARQFFMNNVPFEEVLKKKALDFAGLTLEEKQQVLEFEKQRQEQLALMMQAGVMPPGATPPELGPGTQPPALPAPAPQLPPPGGMPNG